jgi:hypothetical protein
MTGRQLLRRPGYEIDVENILKVCARQGVAVEINANPWRLDLDWRWHRMALDFGCMMSIIPMLIRFRRLISRIGVSKWRARGPCQRNACLIACHWTGLRITFEHEGNDGEPLFHYSSLSRKQMINIV